MTPLDVDGLSNDILFDIDGLPNDLQSARV